MTILALSLVLLSAIIHATWNLFVKRAGGGIAFIWLYMALSVLLYAPLAALLPIFAPLSLSLPIFLLMLASGALHTIYFFCLQRGYRVGELSFVYPLARGTAPLFSTVSAIFILQERPTIIALLGLLLIVVGLFILTGGTRIFIQGIKAQSLLYGICTGLSTAAYTLVDKVGVSSEHGNPILYYYGTMLLSLLLLSPFVLHRCGTIRQEWHQNRLSAGIVAVLSPLAYVLVLTALAFTPISFVAPAREVGVIFGAFMGGRFLAEGEGKRRLLSAALIFIGIVALAL